MKTTVLLIDDSRFLRKANELALSRSGYSVLAASDGEEGLHIACEKIPDLIVLDMMLPKMPGQQATRTEKRSADFGYSGHRTQQPSADQR